MTTFRLNAGRPAAYPSGGSSSRSRPHPPWWQCKIDPCAECDKEAVEIKPAGPWLPNREPDIPLLCGCKIPWPIIAHFGGNIHGQIWCSEHGWQPKITKANIEKAKQQARKERQCPGTSDQLPMMTDPPLF